MRPRAVIGAVAGAAAGAALLWLGIVTSMQPNEGTAEGLYDLVIAALAVWAITAMIVPLVQVRGGGMRRRWTAAAVVGVLGVAATAAVVALGVHVATAHRGTADDRAFLMIGLAPFTALAAAFGGAWVLARPD